jgi:hypothetical protein
VEGGTIGRQLRSDYWEAIEEEEEEEEEEEGRMRDLGR